MSKEPTIVTISTGYASGAVLDSNFQALKEAFSNTVSRDGSTPNTMSADLDLNGNDLLNVGDINIARLYLNGSLTTALSSTPTWQGAWATATDYSVNDLVRQDGNVYIALTDHTSGTFSTDLSNAEWALFASKGSAGAGTGDLLAANDLSDLNDADTALANLGGGSKGIAIFKDTTNAAVQAELELEPGVDVQPYDDVLTDLAGLTLSQGDTLYYNGSNLVNLGKGTAGQVLTMNSGATAPEWADASGGLGVGQTWQDVLASRSESVSYQNTTGKPIMVNVSATDGGGTGTSYIQVSTDNATWVNAARSVGSAVDYAGFDFSVIVPPDHYYRVYSSGTNIDYWAELR